jgi:glutathione synthase/RimK-type ligase-like ATP-grasp enzyme
MDVTLKTPTPETSLRDGAYRLHKQGDLAKAAVLYDGLIGTHPGSADVAGLLALCQFQRGLEEQAFSLWRKCLLVQEPAQLLWRNANNAFAALLSGNAKTLHLDIATTPLAPWPENTTPTRDDMSLACSLAQALMKLGRKDDIIGAFLGFAKQLDVTQAEAMSFLRWALGNGLVQLVEAAGIQRLEKTGAEVPESLLLLAAYHAATGDYMAARALTGSAAEIAAIYVTSRRANQKYVVGVLNRPVPMVREPMSLAEFHFNENTPAGLVNRFGDDFRFVSVFPYHIDEKATHSLAPRPQFYINNWATAEILATHGTHEKLSKFIEGLPVPVLNHPDAVLRTTRQNVSELLQGVRGILVPRVVRVVNMADSRVSTVMLLERELGYPIILREPFQQMGLGTVRADDAGQLLAALGDFPQTQLYAIKYFENPVAPGIYRKFRAAAIGGEIFITHVLFGQHWNVHRERDAAISKQLNSHPSVAGFADKVTTEPHKVLGQGTMDALRDISELINLDIFGIDFDLMPDGRLLLFEANAAMHISFGTKYGQSEVRARMLTALHRLFDKTARRNT